MQSIKEIEFEFVDERGNADMHGERDHLTVFGADNARCGNIPRFSDGNGSCLPAGEQELYGSARKYGLPIDRKFRGRGTRLDDDATMFDGVTHLKRYIAAITDHPHGFSSILFMNVPSDQSAESQHQKDEQAILHDTL